MNKSLLFLFHIPPPVHGSAMVGQAIRESERINQHFRCRYLNLLASKQLAETGKITPSKIAGFVVVWFHLLGQLIACRPRLCYLALTTTGAAFYRDVLLVALLKLFRIKRVYHLHNKGVSRFQNKRVHRFFYRFVFKGVDVILLSKHLYPDVALFVPKEKVHICPNGIKEEPRHKTQDARDKRQETRFRILFLSNLIESKGVFVLLEAMALLANKGIQFEGIFVGGEGDVSSQQFQQKVERLSLNNYVKYLGKKYGAEKEQIFSDADIFAFPTYYSNECFPLVLLEAMSFTLPIISTFEGGILDVVEDGVTGFLVPQQDAVALAVKLELLITNPGLRQHMGEAGRKKYLQQFTLEHFEENLTAILQKVMAKNES